MSGGEDTRFDSYIENNFTVPEKERSEIEVVFNREFTQGFAFGDKKLIAAEKPMNRGAFLGLMENGEVLLQRNVIIGDGIGIWSKNSITGAVIKNLMVNGKKVKSASAGERVNLGLKCKDGSKIFITSSPEIGLRPGFVVNRLPISIEKRLKIYPSLPKIAVKQTTKLKILAKVYSMTEAHETARAGADIVFYNIFSADFANPGRWKEKAVFGAYLPRIMDDSEIELAVEIIKDRAPCAVLAGNAGFLRYRDKVDVPVYIDYSLNAINDLDTAFFREYRAVPILSPELSISEMLELRNKDVVVFCHGDIVLVNTLFPLRKRDIIDEKGLRFPVREENGYGQILNSRPFGMFNDVRQLHAAGFSQFYIDKQGKSAYYVDVYRSLLKEKISDRRLRKGHTSGHLYRPLE